MGTKVNSNYEDLLTFTRASKGHALRPVSYGTEIINNGDFELGDNGDWEKEASWTISGGTATYDGAVHVESLSQNFSLTTGKIIKISYTVKNIAAGKTAYFNVKGSSGGGTEYKGYTNHTEGDYEIIATVAEGAVGLVFIALNSGTGGAFDLDNVSVKEVLFDQPDGTLTLFEHPDNVPRVEYDADRNRLGLLVEESRTNLIARSESFNHSDWSKIRTSVTANDIESPDKQQNGYKVQSTEGSLASNVNETVSKTANTDYTFSVFVKKGNVDRVVVGQQITGAYSNNIYDFSTDTWTTTGSGSPTLKSESVGNGWYRLSVTMDAGATTGNYQNWVGPLDSDATSHLDTTSGNNVYIFGAQLEAGSFPTSYIKSNSGSTTTRSADVASIPVSDFGYNQSEGTVVINFKIDDSSSNKRLVSLNAGNNNNRMDALLIPSNAAQVYVMDGGVNQTNLNSSATYVDKDMAKVAFSYKKDDYVITLDSGTIASDTSATVPTVTTFTLGTGPAAAPINGHIKSIQYYPRRLTNAQLEALTEPRSTPTLSLTFDGLESSYTENYIHG